MEPLPSILYVEHRIAACGRTFSCAMEVARAFGARLTVAGIVGGFDSPVAGSPAPSGPSRQDALRRRWERRLHELVDRRSGGRIPIRTRVLRGPDPEAIEREVAREGHDLVMKAADISRFPRLGPVAAADQRLLRRCPCPVWILDPAEGPGLRLVLAAVDVADGTEELNAQIVRLAASLSRLMGAELHVLHAWSIVGEPILASSMTGLTRRRLRSLRAGTRRKRRQHVKRLLARVAPDLDAYVAMLKGDPIRTIRREARRLEADVVVLGNAARDGLEGLLFGNMAERLVGHIPGSVLALKLGGRSRLAGAPPYEGYTRTLIASAAGGSR